MVVMMARATATVAAAPVRAIAAGAQRGAQYDKGQQQSNAFNHDNNASLVDVGLMINSFAARGRQLFVKPC
jgi:hypothetical protein